MLYGLPEGAFESRRSNKDPAGIVVVWEAASCQSARPGRQRRLRDGGLFTCHVALELERVSLYL